ncbi:phosphopyruvate hydratase [Candidatus Parcubacteria bacterium]|nr:phosphopyruvate hydratase [Candidatus Parcubacteria bacterium]
MNNHTIKSIEAREILDSRGIPTIEVELITELGSFFASVPSGTSTGKNEAKELRDGGERYNGNGVLRAVENVEKIIAPELKGKDVINQKEIDEMIIKLDGTKDKSRLGANAILGVSMAVCRAGASANNLPLYKYLNEISNYPISNIQKLISNLRPCFLMIEGGVHAGNDLDFQEFMIQPREDKFSKNLEIGTEIYHCLKEILEKEQGKSSINVGLEGGFTPSLRFPEQALDLIVRAIEKTGQKDRIDIILDCAASQFFKDKKYQTQMGVFVRDGFFRYYSDLISKYPIIGLEDPFSEEDWQGFKQITKLAENSSLPAGRELFSVIGDDLLVTNLRRVKKAIKENACNSMIVKPNQIGTVSETIEVARYAKENNFKIFVKHRSGETKDDFIADLAVGLAADGIMAGAPARSERLVKYNRLLKIEEELLNK